jgi:predicted DsbA family dithiol-disulfide isomerase
MTTLILNNDSPNDLKLLIDIATKIGLDLKIVKDKVIGESKEATALEDLDLAFKQLKKSKELGTKRKTLDELLNEK